MAIIKRLRVLGLKQLGFLNIKMLSVKLRKLDLIAKGSILKSVSRVLIIRLFVTKKVNFKC